jgi:hypothetical protein
MEKTTIYLTEQAKRRLRQAAKRLGKSDAEITRAALDRYLDETERERSLPPSIGMGSNPDLHARDYEDWLAERWRPR